MSTNTDWRLRWLFFLLLSFRSPVSYNLFVCRVRSVGRSKRQTIVWWFFYGKNYRNKNWWKALLLFLSFLCSGAPHVATISMFNTAARYIFNAHRIVGLNYESLNKILTRCAQILHQFKLFVLSCFNTFLNNSLGVPLLIEIVRKPIGHTILLVNIFDMETPHD